MTENSTEATQTRLNAPPYEITILGNPLPQKRARVVRRGRFAHAYDPMSKIKKSMRSILSMQAAKFDGSWPVQASVSVDLTFYMPIAQNVSNPQKNAKLWGLQFPTSCDIDNLCKFIFDLGNDLLWKDDRQIAYLTARKTYSLCPCTKIIITPINQNMDDRILKVFEIISPEDVFDMKSILSVFTTSQSRSEVHLRDEALALLLFAKKFASKLRKLEKLDAP